MLQFISLSFIQIAYLRLCLQTVAELTASRPVSLRGMYSSVQNSGTRAQQMSDTAQLAGHTAHEQHSRV